VSYLLDTNVVSEWTRPRPDPAVVAFLASTDEDVMFLSVITLAELRRGVDRLAAGRRRTALNEWLENDLIERFDDRILGIDHDVAFAWGRIMARAERRGMSTGVMDVWIAAIAEVHGFTLVTRNVRDFAPILDRILNPWGGAE
jgi:predicted nucleic acid-binding protein